MAKETLVLCDTNIIIEFYKENSSIFDKLRTIGQENIAVSIITVGELLFGALNKKERKQINQDIAHLHLLHLDSAIGDCCIELMNNYTLSHSLSLPDGLIAATAIIQDIPLYTLNKKDFQYIKGIQLYP
ncbi:MAG: pilus assembly protein [Bacteroidetes bacterium]|nr:MAG: pilus assembly protein [Bacteroidota bacterium]